MASMVGFQEPRSLPLWRVLVESQARSLPPPWGPGSTPLCQHHSGSSPGLPGLRAACTHLCQPCAGLPRLPLCSDSVRGGDLLADLLLLMAGWISEQLHGSQVSDTTATAASQDKDPVPVPTLFRG